MRMVRQDPGAQDSDHDRSRTHVPPQNDQAEPDKRGEETAKDVNVVRGDDRSQAVRHSE